MISKTKLKVRLGKKTNPQITETVSAALKNKSWTKYAQMFSQPARNLSSVSLGEVDKKSSIGDTIIIPGKVLSQGSLSKKVKICAFGISKQAREKLKPTKSEFVYVIDEIKKNTKAEGLKILR